VRVGSYVERIGDAALDDSEPQWAWTELAERCDVRCPSGSTASQMRDEIDRARTVGDSVGGTVVVLAQGLPPGLGSHVQWDRRLDGRLAQALMSVQAIKGVEIGPAFANACRLGTAVHDAVLAHGEPEAWTVADAGSLRRGDRSGGLEGGITTGQMLVLRAAMKPIPTVNRLIRCTSARTSVRCPRPLWRRRQ